MYNFVVGTVGFNTIRTIGAAPVYVWDLGLGLLKLRLLISP